MEGDLDPARSGLGGPSRPWPALLGLTRRIGRSVAFQAQAWPRPDPWKIALVGSMRCLQLKGYTHATALPRERSGYKDLPVT